ncbi:MaoC family dehydratase [Achromobacter deleyi]|uniref:MaoC family dehydratase n=1 Tax=Achromobacter deleyi TaxID=1353891 RepID=UPI001492561A|nr:MaoC family dehydratase [Achromobacter deleyi]QVQ28994.1 MaoC family dehydratase [Achromobacter deleyi]UIP19112.1 MaoC family dehydratase [Achromobacter deleyi]
MTGNPSDPSAVRRFDSVQSLIDFQGQPAIASRTVEIDQETIDRFAQVTRDSQWIHVDRERALAESPYQDTIAHGFLVLSLLTHWQESCIAFPGAVMALNYGFDKVRFTAPVRSGSRVSARFALAQVVETKPGEVRCSWNVTIQAEDASRPSVHADWLILIRYGQSRPG